MVDLALQQEYPLTGEESEVDSSVIRAAFADSYILLIRDELSITVLAADESGDLDEVERGEKIQNGRWTSGSLYEDSNDVLRLDFGEDSEDEAGNVLMFLLSDGGGLHVCLLNSRKKSSR